ncbi:succinate dehydrogenase assembly factor 4, mitochondrial [Micropterus dolomieu]|uniref:succinate dehydrogenase assembly factor 4, mitochondrial n=1 Tax=Micropterus dolomieu TaxID=147949 RepID=UPI001E8EEA13|nr:succinate dehydrogenase assembly factor 4, mitochondrial [Micropterus dolomieu]
MALVRLCASLSRHAPAVESVFKVSGCSRAASGAAKDKEPLKKSKTPQGLFDSPEEKSKDVLESENGAGDFSSDQGCDPAMGDEKQKLTGSNGAHCKAGD